MQASSGYLFCNGLPTKKKSFEKELDSPSKDFLQHYVKDRIRKKAPYDWTAYYRQLVLPYETLKRGYCGFGFDFIDECTSIEFMEKIKLSQYRTIIVFSHCLKNGTIDETIEYFDSLILSENIIGMIPDDITRIYDFSVCKCLYLKKQANLLKSKNVFGTSSKNIPLAVWLFIYAEIFKKIITKGCDFIDALDLTFREAEERIKNSNK